MQLGIKRQAQIQIIRQDGSIAKTVYTAENFSFWTAAMAEADFIVGSLIDYQSLYEVRITLATVERTPTPIDMGLAIGEVK